MPLYTYRCSVCGKVFDEVSSVDERDFSKRCECGGASDRDAENELKDNKLTAVANEVDERWSNALGYQPEQMQEAKRIHPGAKFDKRGRMLIRNRQEKKQRMKEKSKATGQNWVEYD